MSKRGKVHVGTLEDMGQRFISVWHRLEKGEKVRERHLTFPDLAACCEHSRNEVLNVGKLRRLASCDA